MGLDRWSRWVGEKLAPAGLPDKCTLVLLAWARVLLPQAGLDLTLMHPMPVCRPLLGGKGRERSSESPWKRHLRTSPWEAAGSRTAAEFMCQASTLNSLKKNKFWDWNCKALMLNCGTPSEHQALCAYASPGDYLMSTKYYNVREPLLPFSRRGNGDLMLVAPSPMKAEVVFDPRHNWNEPE